MTPQDPLISCICITRKRPHLLYRAIRCFQSQTYNNKELVISYPINDDETQYLVCQMILHDKINIIKIERPIDESLGNARNNAIRQCNGRYVCIWDDDDWYHPNRIKIQMDSLQVKGHQYQASVLSQILLYDSSKNTAYLSFPYTWDGTILCRREMLLQNQYADRDRAEDTHVITFLSGRNLLSQIYEAPYLYVYIYHGVNTWDYKHFEHFINKSEKLNDQLSKSIQSMISQ